MLIILYHRDEKVAVKESFIARFIREYNIIPIIAIKESFMSRVIREYNILPLIAIKESFIPKVIRKKTCIHIWAIFRNKIIPQSCNPSLKKVKGNKTSS